MIQAITFDLWDTLVVDDSDEPVRAERGLPTKVAERWNMIRSAVHDQRPDIPEAAVEQTWDSVNRLFRYLWKNEHHTPDLRWRIGQVYDRLGVHRGHEFDDLVDHIARMEVVIPPRLAPGIEACLATLAARWPLAVISDAIVTPGPQLRQILEDHGIARHFSAFVFSDEVGAAKPDRKVFDEAAERLGVPVKALAHVGDREANDVAGPHGVGAKAVLYTGCVDRGAASTSADAVCAHHDQLPAILDVLAGEIP